MALDVRHCTLLVLTWLTLLGSVACTERVPTTPSGPSQNTTPSPQPPATGTDIVLIAVDPPPRSTISLARGVLNVTVSVAYSTSGAYAFFAGIDPRGYQGGGSCVWGGSDVFHLTAGEARTVSFRMTQNPNQAGTVACSPPFNTNVMTVALNFEPHEPNIRPFAVQREFGVPYIFVP